MTDWTANELVETYLEKYIVYDKEKDFMKFVNFIVNLPKKEKYLKDKSKHNGY